jgi:hypothetical protein
MPTPKRARIGERGIDVPPAVQLVAAQLRKDLKNQSATLKPESRADREIEFLLAGAGIAPRVGSARLPLAPFFSHKERVFWLGVSLRYRPYMESYRPKSVSLEIALGALAMGSKQSLLRAEWDEWEDGQSGGHAQPHWHVVIEGHDEPAPAFTEPDVVDFVPSATPKRVGVDRFKVAPMHLAMHARWHLADDPVHTSELVDERIPRWIQGCLAYAKAQIVYSLEQ